MSLTNFPNGITSFGIPQIGQDIPTVTGSVFWVDSAVGLPGNSGQINDPLNTIDAAIGKCTAGAGDLILVKEGHTESLTSAGAIAIDVAGVTILGLGVGNNRPVITFASTDNSASITMSANNCQFLNIVLVCADDGLTNAMLVTGDNCIINVETQDTSAAVEAATYFRLDTANNVSLNTKHIGFPTGNAMTSYILLDKVDTADIQVDTFGIVSTAWVNMVDSASSNVHVVGRMYTQGITNFTRDVVDTITGSTWDAEIFDASAGFAVSGGSAAALAGDDVSAVAAAVAVVDGKIGTITNTGGTATIGAILGDFANSTLISNFAAATPDSVSATNAVDTIGNKSDSATYSLGTFTSLVAYVKGVTDLQEKVAAKADAVMADNDILFTISGGPIEIMALVSECVTGNDATASTLVYKVTPTIGAEQTISGASASLANATAGATVTLAGTSLATAALYNANGPNLIANPGRVIAPAGTIAIDIAVGSTTGTWRHYLRYKPLATGITVS
jgi:hypothetical protein